jgi:hypothetical protein
MSSTKRWRGWFKLPYTGNDTATMATVGSSSLSLSFRVRGGRALANRFSRSSSCFIFPWRRKWNLKMNQVIEHPLKGI